MKQLITISPTGEVTSLVFKGKGVDLRLLGPVDIKRVTDIHWDQGEQGWFIVFTAHMTGGFANLWVSRWTVVNEAGLDLKDINYSSMGQDHTLYFDDYEDAIACEVAVIQALRRLNKA
jgi:hypothetical protein